MNARLIQLPDRQIFRCKDVQMCKCDSIENEKLIQISKYEYNNNKNNDNATWNRNELTICGAASSGSKNS